MASPCENCCGPLDPKKAIRDELMRGRLAAALLGNKLKDTEIAHFVDQIVGSLSKSLALLDAANVVAVGSSSSDVREDQNSAGKVEIENLAEDCKRGKHGKRIVLSPCRQVKSRSKDDGYKWNKYGEKAIKGFTHRRSYFCCSHKGDPGCNAKRHVQIAEDDNSMFIITYIGQHTCKRDATDQGQSSHCGLKNQSMISFESSDYNINVAQNSPILTSGILSDMKPDSPMSENTMMNPNPEIDEGFMLNMGMASDYYGDLDLDPLEYVDEVPPLSNDYDDEMFSFDEDEFFLFGN
ncbi:uncharacterized protein A4U43_C07F5630 [Asparagus officinalis]|uniref:WRKY domain-containing protein n=1 Tax=Asparagus officinalis TaxID=4686 RepID=A0A5P1E9T5_ASPOF|nr:probable WRKY transcription factor 64 [Asparagus officinalis]ONK62584.1 uncharacterized protein A4U43_C07F5630 [Asparagus officinalis]